eukprot:46514-Amorphochlora_amoeboformis.AAC.1
MGRQYGSVRFGGARSPMYPSYGTPRRSLYLLLASSVVRLMSFFGWKEVQGRGWGVRGLKRVEMWRERPGRSGYVVRMGFRSLSQNNGLNKRIMYIQVALVFLGLVMNVSKENIAPSMDFSKVSFRDQFHVTSKNFFCFTCGFSRYFGGRRTGEGSGSLKGISV